MALLRLVPETFKKIAAMSLVERKDVPQLLMKLLEEFGEASQAHLSRTDAPGCGYKGKTTDDFHEELADMFLVLSALMVRDGITTKELDALLNKKMTKWKKVLSDSAKGAR